MTAKEYLYQIKDADERIRLKCEELERLRARAEKTTAEIKERVRSNKAKDTLEIAVARIVDLENEYSADVKRSIALRAKIIDEINQLADSRYRQVLIHRYVEHKDWTTIARLMNYNIRTVFKLHGHALQAFEKMGIKGH